MSFFKPLTEKPTNPSLARLHRLIWVLIYGGLLTLVLGLFVQRNDDTTGWLMVACGVVAATLGVWLIYVRAKMPGVS